VVGQARISVQHNTTAYIRGTTAYISEQQRTSRYIREHQGTSEIAENDVFGIKTKIRAKFQSKMAKGKNLKTFNIEH
jgi:hypothetical protein